MFEIAFLVCLFCCFFVFLFVFFFEITRRSLSPCVLFFDDVEEIAPARSVSYHSGEDTGGASERVVSTFLNELDGIDSRIGVFVVACSKKPWSIDPAIIRKGRMDHMVYVGLPNEEARRKLCQGNPEAEKIASATDGMTCAGILRLMKEVKEGGNIEEALSKSMLGKVKRDEILKFETF